MAMMPLPRNMYGNIMLLCYSGTCPPRTCTVRPWSTESPVDSAGWPPDLVHTRCTYYRATCAGNTPHSDLVCTGNRDLWKNNNHHDFHMKRVQISKISWFHFNYSHYKKKLLFRGNFFLCSSKEALKYWVPSFWLVRNAHQFSRLSKSVSFFF